MTLNRGKGLWAHRCAAAWIAFTFTLIVALPAYARDSGSDRGDLHRYVVELQDPPVALYDGRRLSAALPDGSDRLPAVQADLRGGALKLDLRGDRARAYRAYLSGRHDAFRLEAARLLGRQVVLAREYQVTTNGMAVDLTPAEAAILEKSPQVRSIARDRRQQLDTDAGPLWIGAGDLWNGTVGFPAARGENIVVGLIDSGINWEHPSFADPSPDGYVYSNPFGSQLGLCSDPEVQCNNKLIGVYDFVEDDPSTTDVTEENTKGRDNDGHGSHVASIAVGNRLNIVVNGGPSATLSGVAPHANLVTYRVCYVGEPAGPDTGGCMSSAILSAIDQAVEDGVDAVNYSIGSPYVEDPWDFGSIARAFLAARAAGVFIATSAGNGGPLPSTLSSPANAPWLVSVGNATHDRVFGSFLENMVGGDTMPPDDMAGASFTAGTGQKVIVHARDYGFALCGTGEPELGASCDDNTGASNPWAGQTPFHGEIVVCDRGTYGRVEKGKNVMLAGAGGYVLANTEGWGESVVSDDHCLPATHIGLSNGDTLRAWLASGSGHGARISGFELVKDPRFADQVNASSSRGPAPPPVQDTLKPNLIAPGTSILGASSDGQEFMVLSGTSMASPHVTGAGALLKSVHPDWDPSQIASAIETTATPELATIDGQVPANPRERGAGRPQLGEAANAGLFLEVTQAQFLAANPSNGGNPRNLNLPGMVNSSCNRECSFSRSVTDQMGGGNWTATPVDFPAGVAVQISPSSFSLGNGASRTLTVTVDLEPSGIVGEWVDGRIRLSAAGSPDQYLTVSVFSDGGQLPDTWVIDDDRNGGWKSFTLSGLAGMPDATFTAGGLQAEDSTTEVLVEDPSGLDPYGDEGTFRKWYPLPQGGLWLYAETLPSSADDVDLFVGRDDNENGVAEETEVLCSSTTPEDTERCDLYDLAPGTYWIIVQNWAGTNPSGDSITLQSAGIGPGGSNTLAAGGPGIVAAGASFDVRVSWDNLAELPGGQWLGAVGIGTNRDHPNNIGVIPVRFNRTGIAAPTTFPLLDGVDHRLALDAGASHDRLFIDVPPGASSLTVQADGLDPAQSDALHIDLRRLDFSAAFGPPPFAAAPGNAPIVASDSGGGGSGPLVTVSGGSLQPGRWYAVLHNGNDSPAAVTIRADVAFAGADLPIHRGLWEPNSRPGLGQGYDYNWGGSDRALIWYTYDEPGQPTWYIAGGAQPAGNIWVAPLYRVTNDGSAQHLVRVGNVAVTTLAENDAMFSYTLFGLSGSERMQPLSALTCPMIDGGAKSYTGLWYRGVDGLGGASVIVNDRTQAEIHYLFDALGMPRWAVAQDLANPAPTQPTLPMLQFSGYCAVCQATGVSYQAVGTLDRAFDSQTAGNWTLDYLLQSPLSGDVQRTDSIQKLTDTLQCQ